MNSDFQSKVIYGSCALGLLANGLLLFFIYTDKSPSLNILFFWLIPGILYGYSDIGNCRKRPGNGYQRILAIITFYNIYYSLVHCITDMGFVTERDGFIMFSKTFSKFHYWWASTMATLIYVDAFTMSISLLLIHGLYRYATITGRWLALFQRWKFIVCIVIAHFFFRYLLVCRFHVLNESNTREKPSKQRIPSSDVQRERGPTRVYGPDLYVNEFKWRHGSICILGFRLTRFIRASIISERAKKMNFQLMRLFIIQAVAPLLFEYLPSFLNVYAGPLCFMGFPFYADLGYYIPIFVSFYPFMDALMVFVGFRDYRNRFLSSRVFRVAKLLKGSKIFASYASENQN
ncbi:unnamed protein product, partial [Mesorhabditis belari]|uniref:G protein-coupled receptor n=1 Tax=Mesorhabditis belari TaxID=2138241 RepID=A0AAF3JAL9_9BILA